MAKKQKSQKSSVDVDLVRQAATGRWTEILSSVAGISSSDLDGRHHPCPKCGGTDRFRMMDEAAGAVYCNKCLSTKNGDGFAAIQWANGIGFLESVYQVADHLGIDPLDGANRRQRKKPPPDKHLEFRPWNNTLVALWCRHKPPIIPEAVKAAGGRLARYRGQYTVIAFPIWGKMLDAADPVGWVIVNTTGKALPKFDASGQVEWIMKPKTTYGSGQGIIGDLKRLKTAEAVWKMEGVSDILSWLSMPDIASDHAVITNANGSKEKPLKWICDLFKDKAGYVLHDADKPGQEGAVGWNDHGRHRPGWAEEIAGHATECRNVALPYPVAENQGQDFWDWLTEGGDFSGLCELAAKGEVIQSRTIQANEAIDDPHRLARLNLEQYADKTGGRTIRFWNASWWIWKNCRYREMSVTELRPKLTAFVKGEFDRLNIKEQEEYRERKEAGQISEDDDKGPPVVKKVTPHLTGSILQATGSMVGLSSDIALDTWLPDRKRRNYLSMANGILDVDALLNNQDDVLLEHSPEWFSTVHLPYEFDPAAKCPKWDAFLERNLEMDSERIKLLQEWAGYLLLPDTGHQQFLILVGEGANGKSVFCGAIEAMIESANCSHVQFEVFGDRFSKTLTLGKLVNICGDAGEIDQVAEGVIKAFTAGNTMMFDRKGLPGIHCAPTARLMIACNNLPRFRDRSGGIWRRVLLIPWRIVIAPKDRIRNMDKAAWWQDSGELPGILNWALVGLYRLRSQGGFSHCQIMEDALRDYKLETNPAKQFFADYLAVVPDGQEDEAFLKADFLYRAYRKWASESGYHPLSVRQFGKELRRAFPAIQRVRKGPRSERRWCHRGVEITDGAIANEEMVSAYVFPREGF